MPTHGFGVDRELRLFLTPAGINCRVWIGETDVSPFIRSVSITATAGEPTIVSVDILATDGITAEGMVAALGLTVVTEEELLERLRDPKERA
jgi:hypothetical protein